MTSTKSGLSLEWTAHLRTQKDREAFTESVGHALNTPVVTRLSAIIDERLKAVSRQEETADYSDPSWAYKQAHNNGYRQGLKAVLQLLKHKSDKD